MNEAEWLASADPAAMLRLVTGQAYRVDAQGRTATFAARATDRKLRLFACACQEAFLSDRPGPYARVRETDGAEDDFGAHLLSPVQVAGLWVNLSMTSGNPLLPGHNLPSDQPFKAALLRDIFGNPWRPVRLVPEEPSNVFVALDVLARETRNPPLAYVEPRWLTPLVHDIAWQIYEDREWGDLGILADALEEAGCMDADLLAHLQGPGPHARGCWATDLLLNKE